MTMQTDFETLNERRAMLLRRVVRLRTQHDEALSASDDSELQGLTARVDAILDALYPVPNAPEKANDE